MAYAAVNSLKHTIHRLLNSYRISVVSSTREILEFANEHIESLKYTLQRFDQIKNSSEGVMAADAKIREEARKLEDAIEYHASTQFLSLSLNLDHLRQDINCFAKTAKKMEVEYIGELYKPSPEEETAVSSATDSVENESDMVGLSDQFLMIRDLLLNKKYTIVASISGMAGIGKTTLAKKIFHDSSVKANFECRAFVRIGRRYQLEEILRAIIAQVNLDCDKMRIMERGEGLVESFQKSLRGKKYLVVLDDMWDTDFYRQFIRIHPKQDNGSQILVISRDTRTVKQICSSSYFYQMRFLSHEESWELLKRKVFGEEEECPPLLVKAGKKIAENCEGLPLLIVAVADLLSKGQKNPEYWNEVAEKRNSVFGDACEEISEVLLPSYHYIHQNLKTCFLYMVVFPQNYIVRHSRIVNLWRAEGFLDPSIHSMFSELVSSNLVVGRQYSTNRNKVKACSLHCAYRHLSKREAENNKFLYILNSYVDSLADRLKGHRYLAIHNNVLFAIKKVYNTMASISTIRSLLCTGPYHQYQVPLCLESRLLRVLDALTIRFYEFPLEVGKLFLLRYVALTCNSNLPRSISKLWNLHYLIIHQNFCIKRGPDESYVPVEIWGLKELMHLQIMGRNLPNPPPGEVLLNLRELLDVGVQSCAKGVLKSIPNLKKLRVQIEVAPEAVQIMSCFDHISCFNKLESLQSVILNPKFFPEVIVPPLPPSISLYHLQKLTLCGFGYPWEDMRKIGKLPYLEMLKLQCYAFRGEKWEAKEKEFLNLLHLLIEDTDLVQWTAGDKAFRWLSRLTMKNCHKLKEIPLISSPYMVIELDDCNPLAERCAKQRYNSQRVNANYSWK